MLRSTLAVLVPALLLATCSLQRSGEAPLAGGAPTSRGGELFAHHCSVCHGPTGDADTLVAGLLRPRPRPFRDGLFKLVRTSNGVPTSDDIVHTLQNGMPGSTMMAWDWLPAPDLQALAEHVRELATAGRAQSILDASVVAGLGLDEQTAVAAASAQLTPGPAVEPVAAVAATPAVLAEGERLFARHCAACHGPDGRGLPAVQGWTDAAEMLWPRDFTAGYLRGGESKAELARRIQAGMPGAHMPPTRLAASETAALVTYVSSLIPEGAGNHHRQWRRNVRAGRVAALPADGDLDGWQRIEAVRLPLAPLHWRPEATTEAWLRVAHDGHEIALQLEWRDDTRNDRPLTGAGSMGDGAALQFTGDHDPPLFAMGSNARPVNIWRWQAYDSRETAGMVDLLTAPSHQGLDVPMSGLRSPPRRESIELTGIHSVGAVAGNGLPLAVATSHERGRWRATFRRQLAPRAASEIDLRGQGPFLFAIALWNGAIDLHAASKSITTWHQLELQP